MAFVAYTVKRAIGHDSEGKEITQTERIPVSDPDALKRWSDTYKRWAAEAHEARAKGEVYPAPPYQGYEEEPQKLPPPVPLSEKREQKQRQKQWA